MRGFDSDGFGALRSRFRAGQNMLPLVAGQSVSLFGDYIAYFTLPLFVVSLTGSGTDLGLTAAAETIPMLLFGFAAGVFIDRRMRLRRTLIAADAVRAIAFGLLAMAAFADVATPYMVFGVAFLVGSMSVVFDAGLQALMPAVLGDTLLVTANSRLQLARTLSMTVGPAIAGLIVAEGGGFAVAFTLNAATFAVSAIFVAMLRVTRARPAVAEHDVVEAIKRGLRFLIKDAHLRWATIGATLTNLVFAPLEALLVLFVAERIAPLDIGGPFEALFRDEASIGLFFALQALIGSVGVAFAPAVARTLKLGRMFVAGLVMLGGGFLVVAFSTAFWAVIPAGIALAGVSWMNVALATLRQHRTPPELLGRVISASRTLAWAGLPVGAAAGGFLSESVGLVPVYVAGSGLVLAFGLLLRATPLWWTPVTATEPGRGRRSRRRSREARTTDRTAERTGESEVSTARRSPEVPARAFSGADWGLLAVVAVIWGSAFVLIEEGLESLAPGVVTAGSLVLGAAVLAVFPGARTPVARDDWPRTLVVAALWIAVPFALLPIAQQWIDSATAGMIMGAIPLAAAIAAAIWTRRLPRAGAAFGLAAGLLGVMLIALPASASGGRTALGVGLSVIAVSCFGASVHLVMPLQRRYGALPVMRRALLVAALLTLPLGAVSLSASSWKWSSAGAGAALGLAGAAVASTAMTTLIGRIGAARAAVAVYFVPLIAVMLGVTLRNDVVSGAALFGVGLILAGAWLSTRRGEPDVTVATEPVREPTLSRRG